MSQTTTVIFILATLLVAATVVSGHTPDIPVAPSPTINEAMNRTRRLTVCLPAFARGGTPSQECCTALDTAVKTQLSWLCRFIKAPELVGPFNITAFNACGINTYTNLCSETTAQAPLPHTIAPAPGAPKADKNAASKPAETGLVGIVVIMISAIFY